MRILGVAALTATLAASLAGCSSPPAATEFTDTIRHAGVATHFLGDDELLDAGRAACGKLAGGQDPVKIRGQVIADHTGLSVVQASTIVLSASRLLCQDQELPAEALS